MIGRTVEQSGQIDILYNNAGIPMGATPIEEVEDALLRQDDGGQRPQRPSRRQARGAAHEAPGRRRDPEHGLDGRHPSPPGLSAYAASKGAVIALTKALAIELAPFKIRVVSINPVADGHPDAAGLLRQGRPGRDAREVPRPRSRSAA